MNKQNIYFSIFAIIGILLAHELWQESQRVEAVPYSQLETLLQKGEIKELNIYEDRIVGILKEVVNGNKEVVVANRVEPRLAEQLRV